MRTQPLISVIIPCYNVQEFIENCVQSILLNNYNALELILINDGSTDQTLSLLRNIKDQYSTKTIILVNQLNNGLSMTRNIGIEIASGEYIMFVDSDDWVSKNYFKSFIDKREKVELVLGSYYKEFTNKSVVRKNNLNGETSAKDIQRRIVGLVGKEMSDPSQSDSIVTLWSKLYKRSIIQRNNIYIKSVEEIGTAEDLLFNLEYLDHCKKVYCLDEPLYHYRKNNDNSFTSIYKEELFIKWQNLFGHIEAIILNKDKIFQIAFNNRICLSIIGLGINELKNPNGISSINKNLKLYLSTYSYLNAYRDLELKYFPFHWKCFFLMAKYKFTFGLYLMLLSIRKLMTK